jgi:hypothetical protein
MKIKTILTMFICLLIITVTINKINEHKNLTISDSQKIIFNKLNYLFSDKPISLKLTVDTSAINEDIKKSLKIGFIISDSTSKYDGELYLKSKVFKTKVKLKGDLIDHIKSDRPSLKFKMNNQKSLMSMTSFSLSHPKVRSFQDEYIFHKLANYVELLSPHYGFVLLSINSDKSKIYSIEERLGQNFIKNKKLIPGIILKYDDSQYWQEKAREKNDNVLKSFAWNFSDIKCYENKKVKKNKILKHQLINAKSLLKNFDLPLDSLFNIDEFAKYFALVDIFGFNHALVWHNINFYYNALSRKFSPIRSDGNKITRNDCLSIFRSEKYFFYNNYSFKDSQIFVNRYHFFLRKYSNRNFMDKFFKSIENELSLINVHLSKDFFAQSDWNKHQIITENINFISKYLKTLK